LVRDLRIDPKFTIVASGDLAVASVSAPRIEEEVKPEEAEAAAGAEPELIGAKEKEEGAEEEGAEPSEKSEKKAEKAEKKEEKKEKKEKKEDKK
jgi:hypothetical protein